MYGSQQGLNSSRYTEQINCEKVISMEMDEKTPLSSLSSSQPTYSTTYDTKKWMSMFSIGTFGGILGATLILLLGSSSSSTLPLESTVSSSSSISYCADNKDFSKQTLKPVLDRTVFSLLKPKNLKGESKFEASDITYKDGYYYTVCDSSWAILKVHEDFNIFAEENTQIGDPSDYEPDQDSDFESIILDSSTGDIYAIREAIDLAHPENTDKYNPGESPEYHSIVMKLEFNAEQEQDVTDFHVSDACPCEHQFEGRLNGIEGALALRGKDGVLYILGLCEGNHCAEGDLGDDSGNGKMIVMARQEGELIEGYDCYWKTIRMIDIPKSAFFQDYSAISLHRSSMTAAITSQLNSQLWVGTLKGGGDGEFDPMTVEFDADSGVVYDFPRNANCEIQYCNVEGIQWVESGPEGDDDPSSDAPRVLAAVSDKMKNNGRQNYTCLDKDQSFHLFALP